MRDEMKALDDFEMGDLWTAARDRTPRSDHDPEPRRSPASRVIAAVAALAIAGAAFVFIRAGFGDEQRTTVGPDPESVCPSKSHLDPSFVDLNGTEVSTDVLAEPGVSRDQLTLLPASVVDEFFTNPEAQLSDAPTDGWRPILEDQEHGRVVIAAPMPDGKTWYYVNFVKDGGEWSLAGWGANVPYATAAQRGEGLHLEWRGDVLYDPRSSGLGIWLVNDRSETWVDDRGEYWAIVHVFDPTTGDEIPQGPAAIAGVGQTYRVPPGGSVELPLAFGDMSSVPAGTYPAVACVPDLALASPVGTVTVVPSTASANETAGSIVVPDLIGLKDQEALRSLNDLKLKWDVALREVPGADPWRVTSSDPLPGTQVDPGSTVRIVIATTVTPLPDGAADALACPVGGRVAFGGPRIRITPGGSAYITGNTSGISHTDKIVQETFSADEWYGIWHVIRDGQVVAVVAYPSLDGEACAGSGIAGS